MMEAPKGPPMQVGKAEPLRAEPVGCVCPPGANLTCERPDCPRRPGGSTKGFGPGDTGDLVLKGQR